MTANQASDGSPVLGVTARDAAAAATTAFAPPAHAAGDAEAAVTTPPASVDNGFANSPTSFPTQPAQPAAASPSQGLSASQAVHGGDSGLIKGAHVSEAADMATSSELVAQDVQQGRGDFVRAEKSPSAWLAQQAQAAGAFSHESTRDASKKLLEATEATVLAATEGQPEGFLASTQPQSGPPILPSADADDPEHAEQLSGSAGGGGNAHPAVALVSNVWLPTGLPRHKLVGKPAVGSGMGGPPNKAAKNGGGSDVGVYRGGDGWEGGLVKPKVKRVVDTGGQESSGARGSVAVRVEQDGSASEGKLSRASHKHKEQSEMGWAHNHAAFLSQFLHEVQDAVKGSHARFFAPRSDSDSDKSRSPS